MSSGIRTPRQQAETRRRAIKQAGRIAQKVLDVPHELVEAVGGKLHAELVCALEAEDYPSDVGSRDLLSAGVASHLPDLVSQLEVLGIRRTPAVRRAWKVDENAWRCLVQAADLTGLPIATLAKACLVLLADRGLGNLDLEKTAKLLAQGRAQAIKGTLSERNYKIFIESVFEAASLPPQSIRARGRRWRFMQANAASAVTDVKCATDRGEVCFRLDGMTITARAGGKEVSVEIEDPAAIETLAAFLRKKLKRAAGLSTKE